MAEAFVLREALDGADGAGDLEPEVVHHSVESLQRVQVECGIVLLEQREQPIGTANCYRHCA